MRGRRMVWAWEVHRYLRYESMVGATTVSSNSSPLRIHLVPSSPLPTLSPLAAHLSPRPGHPIPHPAVPSTTPSRPRNEEKKSNNLPFLRHVTGPDVERPVRVGSPLRVSSIEVERGWLLLLGWVVVVDGGRWRRDVRRDGSGFCSGGSGGGGGWHHGGCRYWCHLCISVEVGVEVVESPRGSRGTGQFVCVSRPHKRVRR